MKQQITANGITYDIELYHNNYVWCAVEKDYDGPEDHYRSAVGTTVQEAIDILTEKLVELEEKNKNKNKP